MNWIFKGSELQPDNNKEKAVVIITQKQNFRGKEGENVLILEKKKEGWEFTSIYKITSIAIKNLEEESKEITINLDLIKQFDGEKLLEDYVYSLHRVTNYANPISHFNRKYNRLYDAEFRAIVDDEIYQKRQS